MELMRHFRPLKDALEDSRGEIDNSIQDFDYIRDYTFIAMFHRSPVVRTHAELALFKKYGNAIKRAFCEGGNIYLEVTNGEESRAVLLEEVPEFYSIYPERVHPFIL